MTIKTATEEFLAASGLNFTVFRLCGFMQARARLRAQGTVAMPCLWDASAHSRRGCLSSCQCHVSATLFAAAF